MKHNDDGRQAEEAVAEFLSGSGYKILDRNWRTKQCEIDVIACKDGRIHFVEVKFRSSATHGSGFDYITHAKLRQMQFAAQYWVVQNGWEGEYVLSGASVAGFDFAIDFIPQL